MVVPRSEAGLGPFARFGQAGALTLLVWQLLVLWQWRLPFEKSAELAPKWRAPFELAAHQVASEDYPRVRDAVVSWGPTPQYPWLLPACAVVLVLLVRVVRLPEWLQWFLGTAAAAYGVLSLYVAGPGLLYQWPLTALLLALGYGLLHWIRIE
ncbi:hypothetical protein [Streptomyces sp. WAC06614]|uniref:hypothetical protein n=1 Tax=Streptomyces sp. WAC06614 TaxID=2487416 RepID=UPI000F79F332|nr:hypothetical protein [Streptomyces sp. WAC06614]RSS81941.1 hypothetical protein EF918_08705 [Streptomyces sp. WAC06614]